ncbi:ribbon-helix-helix domain-containing protein [Novosphingobium naphthalenivorans]|uniref:ribbon-helix-helix domain-containing protein n=1 Tax=Novosphingobium naphthalenivorans TaxID=273168 RepID=UPI0008318D8E|nr:ribbon-helix-helix domain-containing protein [Novosphingobium naphthalenivorans]
MCRLFSFSSPESYSTATRKLRINGHSTSVRLEKGFWNVLEQMAQAEGKSLGRLVTVLHDEMRRADADLTNFSSCLRVMALHYGMARSRDALTLG